MSEPKFEKMDYLKGNDAFSEYVNFYDNKDQVVVEEELVKYACKMPLKSSARRDLVAAIKSSLE